MVVRCLFFCIFSVMLLAANAQSDKPYTGSCTSQGFRAPVFEITRSIAPIYIGSDPIIIKKYVTDTALVVTAATSIWKKTRAKDCKSARSSDCFIWCIPPDDPIYFEVEGFLKDTSVTKDFILEKFEKKKLVSGGTAPASIEVICRGRVTETLLANILDKLINHDFASRAVDFRSKAFNQALIDYQDHFGLQTVWDGNISYELLQHMEIDYLTKP